MVDLSLLDSKPGETTELQDLPVSESEDELLTHLIGETESTSITELDRVIAFFVAKGISYEQACERLGLSEQYAAQIRERQEIFQLVLQIQTALQLSLPDQLKALAPLALQRKMELVMFSKDERVINSASSFIIEQAVGKATQKVEVQSRHLNAREEAEELDRNLDAANTRLEQLMEERQRVLEAKAS